VAETHRRKLQDTVPAGSRTAEGGGASSARHADPGRPSPAGTTVPGHRRGLGEGGGPVGPAPWTTEPDLQHCPRCASSLPRHFHFCGSCGFNLGRDAEGLAYRDPLIGVVVGDRYRLLARIGVGGMGTVYRAEHIHMGKVVAVKLLHGDLSRDLSMIRRFTREARAASRLSSPHTVSVFDYGQNDGLIYLVMEYLQGQDLGQVLRARGRLDLAATSRIVSQVARSLAEAHAHGIIHRDLKPENIFLCGTEGEASLPEHVKVLDFGLAKLRETREESLVSSVHGNLVGTPYYMSPEQISGHEIDVRSDVYSLGAVCFKLLTGQPPFHHQNPVAVLGKHLSEPPPRASGIDPDLEPVDGLLAKALAKKPAERFRSVEELDRALRQIANDPSAEPATFPSPEPAHTEVDDVSTRRDFDRFERWLKIKRVAAVLVALLVVGAAGYGFFWGVVQRNFVRSEREKEPNETPADATRLFLGESILGTIGPPVVGQRADNDFFLIENEHAHPVVLTLTLTGVPGLDLVMKAYDQAGHELVSVNSGGEGEGEVIPNLLLSGRYLYVQVREYWVRNRPPRYNVDHPYTLAVMAREPLENEEREPNERVTQALQTRNGERYVGLIGWSDDVDLYRAPELRTGGRMVEVELTGGGTLDLELRAYNIAETELFRWNRAPAGQPERAVFFAAAEGGHGALFIGVAAADDGYELEEHYELTIRLTPVEGLRGF
jgi:eukaryotic-like serine/threonine-protein kinase